MEALVVFGLFVALVMASLRWGYDSRDRMEAKEETLARYGLIWPTFQ